MQTIHSYYWIEQQHTASIGASDARSLKYFLQQQMLASPPDP
jgi:hypothetical protein